MDKNSLRSQGIIYRSSLTEAEVRAKSASMSQLLSGHLQSLPQPYLTYTALLPGELNPANAFIDSHVVFIKPYKNTPMEYEGYQTIIIPMVAADKNGNRLGMGGGWFDRFLVTQPNSTVVGCCYDAMIFDELPSEPHDIPVDYIVTESAIISRHA